VPVGLKTRIDLRDVRRGLRGLRRAASDLRPAWRELRTPFRKEQREHFRDQEGPDGKWPALQSESKSRNLRRARRTATKRGRPMPRRASRKMLGKLRSFAIMASRRRLRAISKIPFSGIHQEGGRAGHGARIPRRTHLWVSDQFERVRILPAIARHMLRKWRR